MKYLLIQPDEDGKPITLFNSREELNAVLDDPEDYGVKKFLEDWPEEKDPQYWNEGEALILEVSQVLYPKPAVIKYRI